MPSELRVDKVSSTTSPYDPVFSTTGGALSHRNMIINGSMQVAQRGTSFSDKLGANTSYTLDRFATEWYNGSETAKATISQYSLGTTESPRVNEGLIYAYKLDCTTAIANQNANTNNLETIDYKVEAQDCQRLRYGTASAQTVSLSFWFKSPKAGIHIVSLMQLDNSNKIYLREFTITTSNTWQKIHVTFPGDTSGVINNDNGGGLRISWPLFAGNDRHGSKDEWRAYGVDHTTSNQQNLLDNTANDIYLTGVQLELGSVATPFEHRSYADELQRCMRYYTVLASIVGTGYQNGTTQLIVPIGDGGVKDPSNSAATSIGSVPFRATPTISGTLGSASFANHSGSAEFTSNTLSTIIVSTTGTITLTASSTFNTNGQNDNSSMSCYYNGKTIDCSAEF